MKAFFIDMTKCSGCKACSITCKDKNNVECGHNLRNVKMTEMGKFPKVMVKYCSTSCHNCLNAPCVKNCPTGAMNRDNEFGVVVVNKDVCVGCGTCAKSCPFKVPYVDPEQKKSMKCDFCIDLLRKGENPACVDVCNARALKLIDTEDIKSMFKGCKPIKGDTKPNTYVIE